MDTATRVLSVRDLVTDTEAEGDPAEAGTAGDSGEDAETAEEPGESVDSAASGGSEEPGESASADSAASGGAGKSRESEKSADAGSGDGEATASNEDDGEDVEDGEDGPRAEDKSEDGAGKAEEAEKAGTGEEAAQEGEAGAGAGADGTSEGLADHSSGDAPEDASEAGGGTGTDTGADADAEGDDETHGKDEAEAAPEAGSEVDAGDSTDTSGPDTEPEPGPEAKPESEAKSEPEAEAAPPVDQPTAVFRAPKPEPAVDQPTTMLKWGGSAKSDAKGAGKEDRKPAPREDRKPAPKAEDSDVERTSRFVALKPLDAPETRRPQPRPGTQPQSQPAAESPDAQTGPERTTQQPLPPKPPLDLLAELTNTPPPPETPLRTAVRRVKIWTPLVVLLAIVFAIVQAVRPLPSPTLALTAKDGYTFDGGRLSLPWPSEGQGWMDVDGIGTMGHFGRQTPVAIGSVAKTMTAYIVLRDHPLKPGQEGPKIKVDATAEKEGGYDRSGGESTLNTVKAGDFLTEKQALSAVMIPSANNIARLLARWDAGSEAAFVKKMNDTAEELGMTGTRYTDPSGLKETTVSTARDQVRLGNAVVRNPALVAITGAASWTDPSGHNWSNYNELPYRIGAIGVKTGTTTAAGGNLLFAARKTVGGQTVTVVGAILGQHKPSILDTVNAVSKTALLAAEDALTSAKILKKGDVVGYVDDRLGGHTPVVAAKDLSAVGWAGLKVKLSFTAGDVPHTAKAGTEVGSLTVGDGSHGGAIKVPVALQKDLAEPGFAGKLTRLG